MEVNCKEENVSLSHRLKVPRVPVGLISIVKGKGNVDLHRFTNSIPLTIHYV